MVMGMIRAAKALVFLAWLYLCVSYATFVLVPKWQGQDNTPGRIAEFYAQPRDSIDVLFFGGSSYRAGIAPLAIWQEYGIAGFSRASSVQAPEVSVAYLEEALKYQKPSVVVLDPVSLFGDYDVDLQEAKLRQSLDGMKFSASKVRAAREVVRHSQVQTLASYIFPVLRYHSRWNVLTRSDFVRRPPDPHLGQRGAYMDRRIVPQVVPANFMKETDLIRPCSKRSRKHYEKIAAICRKHGISLVLATLPRLSWRYSRHLGVRQFAAEHGLTYIDYNLPDLAATVSIDAATDFYDHKHLNVQGALKVSRQLGGFLRDRYALPDRRPDPAYARWNEDAAAFRAKYDKRGSDQPGARPRP